MSSPEILFCGPGAASDAPSMGPLLVIDVDVDDDDPSIGRDPAAVLHLRIGATGTVLEYAERDRRDDRRPVRRTDRGAGHRRYVRTAKSPSACSWSPPRERTMLQTLNATERALPDEQTITASFRAQVDRTPDAPAVTANGVTLTYRELAAAADRIAGTLTGAGIVRGSRVGLALAATNVCCRRCSRC